MNIFRLSNYIAKYLTGSLTTDEKSELQAWLNGAPGREKLLEQWDSGELLRKKLEVYAQVEAEKAFRQFQQKKRIYNLRRKRLTLQRWSIAALVMIFLGIGVLLWSRKGDRLPEVSVPVTELPQPGGVKAVLTLATGEQLLLDKSRDSSQIEFPGGVVDPVQGKIKYHVQEEADEQGEENMNILYVPRGGEFLLVLEEGTKVWLNAESQLKYPVHFTGRERKVHLNGEAYFEVAPDSDHPFQVIGAHNEVTALGTAFDMRVYADEAQQTVTLVSGKVKVAIPETEKQVLLMPGDQAVLDLTTGAVSKRQVDVLPYCAWREGRLVFRQTTLETILNNLARWYDVNVQWMDVQLKKLEFTGEILKYTDLTEVLDVIATGKEVQFKVEKRTIFVYQ